MEFKMKFRDNKLEFCLKIYRFWDNYVKGRKAKANKASNIVLYTRRTVLTTSYSMVKHENFENFFSFVWNT